MNPKLKNALHLTLGLVLLVAVIILAAKFLVTD